MTFDATTQANIDQWLNGPYDAETKTQIQAMIAAGEHADKVGNDQADEADHADAGDRESGGQ